MANNHLRDHVILHGFTSEQEDAFFAMAEDRLCPDIKRCPYSKQNLSKTEIAWFKEMCMAFDLNPEEWNPSGKEVQAAYAHFKENYRP